MKKVKVSRKGRVCKFPRCKNILSIYNHATLCNVHLDKVNAPISSVSLERVEPREDVVLEKSA
ncbi:MAG: hypothetical protein ACM3L6_08015 [Deltaproteobacteria bacterium]